MNINECISYIDTRFSKLFNDQLLKYPLTEFSFSEVKKSELEYIIKNLNKKCSPGNHNIPFKLYIDNLSVLLPILLNLINECLRTKVIPNDWKSALITPLYKGKGSRKECSNYRGISVLPPVTKIFEIVLSNQLNNFFINNNLINNHQHGFRKNFSCETALHELFNELNLSRDKKKTVMLLFIDFRKAFDTVNPKLLLNKLKNYKLNNDALELLINYFECRTQIVKLNQTYSKSLPIKLGVPQGSVLGPLFFSIFINDLPFLLNLHCKLFADDTTLFKTFDIREKSLSENIEIFKADLVPLLDWCNYNKMDINWSKTYFMFVSGNRKVKTPNEILINNNVVSIVNEFKLLGVLIDNNINFQKNISYIIKKVNPKIYSIKKLFHLPFSVRIQFYKTFILPYFDYFLSLIIYYPKYSIQKLQNFYYTCIIKLFGLSVYNLSYEDAEKKLVKYGLFSFEYRVLLKLDVILLGILNSEFSSPCLKELLIRKSVTNRYI